MFWILNFIISKCEISFNIKKKFVLLNFQPKFLNFINVHSETLQLPFINLEDWYNIP